MGLSQEIYMRANLKMEKCKIKIKFTKKIKVLN
jgi:hypothetical protein